MLNFANFLDLPLIWYGLIATALFLYVLLDGFDLGVGILFPFAPSETCRNHMINSVAPFWDGNETWLVLSGGGLFAAFPMAYAILMPALYIPVIIMLLGLIFRGVAFEFRFKAAGRSRLLWDYSFHFGSLVAAFSQGIIIGAFVQGIIVRDHTFAGGAFDWLNAYSIMTGVALLFGYCILGATWLVMKTENETQAWARKAAGYTLGWVGLFLVIVSTSMPLMDPRIEALWFTMPNFFLLLPIPLLTLGLFVLIWKDLRAGYEYRPFLAAIGVFLTAYIGLLFSMWPWVVPFDISFRTAAAAPTSQTLMLIGTIIMLPVVLAYTGYCYYLFRGKVSEEGYY